MRNIESVKAMKKIVIPLILSAVFLTTISFNSAYALCSNKKEVTVGAACSIQELNKNLEKNKSAKINTTAESKRERNLRPVRLNGQKPVSENAVCLVGDCLYKSLLEK